MQFDTIHAVPAICWQPGTITVLAQKIWLHVMSVLQNYQNSVYFFLSVNPFRGTVRLICGSLQGWVRTISWPDKWSMNWMQWFFLWSKYVLLFAIEKLQHDTFDKYFHFSHQFFSFLFFFRSESAFHGYHPLPFLPLFYTILCCLPVCLH